MPPKFRYLMSLIGLSIINIVHQSAYALSSLDSDTQIKQQISKVFTQNKIPGGAIIIYDNGQIRQFFIGVSNQKNHLPVTANTVFELGSVTKTFTANILAQYVIDKSLTINQPITDFDTQAKLFSKYFTQVSFLELATHTSALPYEITNLKYNSAKTESNVKLYNQFLKNWQPNYAIGSKFLYSNPGYALLGNTLTYIEHKPLPELYQTKIFNTLQMNSTALTVSPKNNNYAQGYDGLGNPKRTPDEGIFGGSWAIKSTSLDMSKYLKASFTANDLRSAFELSQTGFYQFANGEQQGLAWNIFPLDTFNKKTLLEMPALTPNERKPKSVTLITNPKFNPNALIEKTGATDGFNSYIGLVPQQQKGIVIMTNHFSYDYRILKNIGRQILLNNWQ